MQPGLRVRELVGRPPCPAQVRARTHHLRLPGPMFATANCPTLTLSFQPPACIDPHPAVDEDNTIVCESMWLYLRDITGLNM